LISAVINQTSHISSAGGSIFGHCLCNFQTAICGMSNSTHMQTVLPDSLHTIDWHQGSNFSHCFVYLHQTKENEEFLTD